MHVPTRRAIYLSQAPTMHTEAYLEWAKTNIADPADPPTPEPVKTPEQLAAEDTAKAKTRLVEIDRASIRGIREYIAAQADAPKVLKDSEAAAVQVREKLAADLARYGISTITMTE